MQQENHCTPLIQMEIILEEPKNQKPTYYWKTN